MNAQYWRRLAAFTRVITFDKNGELDCPIGSRISHPGRWSWGDDLRAVMDAAGVERAVLMGVSEGGPLSVQFAATYSRAHTRVGSLVRMFGTPGHQTIPGRPRPRSGGAREARQLLQTWGTVQSDDVARFAPSMTNDHAFIEWFARFCHYFQQVRARPWL